jgi:hypothetical protein
MADGESLEPEHVGHRDLAHHRSKQLWSLVGDSGNKKSAIGTSLNYQMVTIRKFLFLEVLRSGNKIIKTVLLFVFHTGLVPFFAVLTSTTNVCNYKHGVKIVHENHS